MEQYYSPLKTTALKIPGERSSRLGLSWGVDCPIFLQAWDRTNGPAPFPLPRSPLPSLRQTSKDRVFPGEAGLNGATGTTLPHWYLRFYKRTGSLADHLTPLQAFAQCMPTSHQLFFDTSLLDENGQPVIEEENNRTPNILVMGPVLDNESSLVQASCENPVMTQFSEIYQGAPGKPLFCWKQHQRWLALITLLLFLWTQMRYLRVVAIVVWLWGQKNCRDTSPKQCAASA